MIKGIQAGTSSNLPNTKAQKVQPDLFTKLMALIRQTNSGLSVKSGKSNPIDSLFPQSLQAAKDGLKEKKVKDQSLSFLLPAGNAPSTQPEKILALFMGKKTASRSSKETLLKQGNTGLNLSTTSDTKKTDLANPSTKISHADQKIFTNSSVSDIANAILGIQAGNSGKAQPAIKAAPQIPNQNQTSDLQSTPARLSGIAKAILGMQAGNSGKAQPVIKAAQQIPNQNQTSDLPSTSTSLSGIANNDLSMQAGNSGKAQPVIKAVPLIPSQDPVSGLQSLPVIESSLMQTTRKSGRISPSTSKSGKAEASRSHASPMAMLQNGGNNPLQQPAFHTMQLMVGKSIPDSLTGKQEGVLTSNESILGAGEQTVSNGYQAQQTGFNPQNMTKLEKTSFISEQHRTWPVSEAMQEIARKAGNGRVRLEIRLDPPQLGKIRVALESDANNRIQVHFLVDQVQSRQIIEQQLPVLKQALQQQGLSMGNFSMQGGRQQGEGFLRQSSSTPDSESVHINTNVSDTQTANNPQISHGSGNLNIHI